MKPLEITTENWDKIIGKTFSYIPKQKKVIELEFCKAYGLQDISRGIKTYKRELIEEIYPEIKGFANEQLLLVKEARGAIASIADILYETVYKEEEWSCGLYFKLPDITIAEDFLSLKKKTKVDLLLHEYVGDRVSISSNILLNNNIQELLTTSYRNLQKDKRRFKHQPLQPRPLNTLAEFVRSVSDRICDKVRKREILTAEDLKEVKDSLQPTYMPFQNEDNLGSIEQSMLSDVLRKRELYAKKRNIDWHLSLDPERQLRKISKDSPLIDRIRGLFVAEAELEYSVLNNEIEERWYNHEINYETLVKMSRDLYTAVFGSLILR